MCLYYGRSLGCIQTLRVCSSVNDMWELRALKEFLFEFLLSLSPESFSLDRVNLLKLRL